MLLTIYLSIPIHPYASACLIVYQVTYYLSVRDQTEEAPHQLGMSALSLPRNIVPTLVAW